MQTVSKRPPTTRYPTHIAPRGFTLFELLVTLTLIAIVAGLVIPMIGDNDRLRLMAAASVMTSDIELAQVMTIADPDQPVIVRFDPDNNRYWLALADTPDTPIPREDTGADYLVVLGQGRAGSATGVTFTVSGMTADTLVFGAQGGLTDFTATPAITLASGDDTIELSITASTGTIVQTDG